MAFSSLASKEVALVWSSVRGLLAQSALRIVGDGDAQGDTVDDDKDTISAATQLAKWTANLERWTKTDGDADGDGGVPEGAVESMRLLHGLLHSSVVEENTKNEICLVCETWKKRDLPGVESVTDNAVMYLLKRATDVKGTKADVKRVWNMHETVLNFSLSHASSAKLRSLLLKAAQTPNFVRSPDGVRFIVFLFTLSPGFVEDIHESIKDVLRPDEK